MEQGVILINKEQTLRCRKTTIQPDGYKSSSIVSNEHKNAKKKYTDGLMARMWASYVATKVKSHMVKRSTLYFHNKASVRRKKNHINKIKDSARIWQEAENRDAIIIYYFTKLFSTSIQEPDLSFLNHMSSHIDERMHRLLHVEFTQEEVVSTSNKCILLRNPN